MEDIRTRLEGAVNAMRPSWPTMMREMLELPDSGEYSVRELCLLFALDGKDGATIPDIPERARPSLTVLANRGMVLEAGGRWRLTNEGRGVVNRMLASRLEAMARVLREMPAEARHQFMESWDRMAKGFKTSAPA